MLQFILLLDLGMYHLPVNLCFVFWGGTHQDIEDVSKEFSEPASQRSVHVENLDIWKVRDIIIDCIREEFSDSASSSSSTTDAAMEWLSPLGWFVYPYNIMLRDLTAALLWLQQQLVVGEGQNWQYHNKICIIFSFDVFSFDEDSKRTQHAVPRNTNHTDNNNEKSICYIIYFSF